MPASGLAGHPRGLYALFFTEMWERLGYYGMRALLILFMVDTVQKGGLGLNDKMAAAWLALARRRLNPSLPAKFPLGLFLLGAGFLAMSVASRSVAGGQKALPTWLVLTYLLHSVGELCLSPVGLSSVTKLAPPRLVGQMMGVWFLATSLGNLLAGLIAGEFDAGALHQMPGRYLQIVIDTAGCGVLLACLIRPIKKLMARVE